MRESHGKRCALLILLQYYRCFRLWSFCSSVDQSTVQSTVAKHDLKFPLQFGSGPLCIIYWNVALFLPAYLHVRLVCELLLHLTNCKLVFSDFGSFIRCGTGNYTYHHLCLGPRLFRWERCGARGPDLLKLRRVTIGKNRAAGIVSIEAPRDEATPSLINTHTHANKQCISGCTTVGFHWRFRKPIVASYDYSSGQLWYCSWYFAQKYTNCGIQKDNVRTNVEKCSKAIVFCN